MYMDANPNQPPCTAMAGAPIVVVGPQYCPQSELELIMVRKIIALVDGNYEITDTNGNLHFNLTESLVSIRDRRILLDNVGNPVVTITRRVISAHDRYDVFRGDSTDPYNLLFCAKKSSLIQIKTKLDVFLKPHNAEEAVPDFILKGSLLKRRCTVCAGDGTTIVGQMKKKHTVAGIVFGKKSFSITIQPNIDSAFIVALIVIILEIYQGDDRE